MQHNYGKTMKFKEECKCKFSMSIKSDENNECVKDTVFSMKEELLKNENNNKIKN